MTDHSLLRCCGNCAAAMFDERSAWCEYLQVDHPITHCCDYHEWDEDDDDLVNPA